MNEQDNSFLSLFLLPFQPKPNSQKRIIKFSFLLIYIHRKKYRREAIKNSLDTT